MLADDGVFGVDNTKVGWIPDECCFPEFSGRQKSAGTPGKVRLFYSHLADELFYFLAVVAKSKQGFTADDFGNVEVNQGFVK